jgi:thiol-disulfide isomerase/thioredoxin
MLSRLLLRYLILLIFTVALTSVNAAPYFKYHPNADPNQDFKNTLKKAQSNDKLVLVVFGSNWCSDCRSLNEKMNMAPLKTTVNNNFEVVHVDIGNWDKNIAFTKQFGKPVDAGIPSIVILAASGTLYYISEAGEFASARRAKAEQLNNWFANKAQQVNNKIGTKKRLMNVFKG